MRDVCPRAPVGECLLRFADSPTVDLELEHARASARRDDAPVDRTLSVVLHPAAATALGRAAVEAQYQEPESLECVFDGFTEFGFAHFGRIS